MFWIYLNAALFFGYVSCGSEVLLDLSAEPGYDTITDVYLGQKLRLKATASFPEGQSTSGVIIELLPSVGSPSMFALAEIVSYTKGSELTTTSTLTTTASPITHADISLHKGPDYVDTTLKHRYDTRAVFNIGTVTSAGSGSAADNQIVIVFDVVYISIGGLSDGDEYKLSIGEEYADGAYIWISQISVNLKDNAGTESGTPIISADTGADSNIAVGASREVDLLMQLPFSASTVLVQSTATGTAVNNVFLAEMYMKSAADAYGFGIVPENIFVRELDACPGNNSLELDLGRPINKESKETSPDWDTFFLVITVVLEVVDIAHVGSTFTLDWGVTIDGTTTFVDDFSLAVTAPTWTPFTTFTVSSPTLPTVSPGFGTVVEFTLDIPPNTNHDYTINLQTSLSSGNANALSILSIAPLVHGNNIPCDIPSSAIDVTLTETVTSSGLNDVASLSVNISNRGLHRAENITADSDQYTFMAYVMVLASAVKDEVFTLSVDVNSVGAQSVDITAGDVQSYPTDVNYSIAIETDCTQPHSVGSVHTFNVKISTERSVTAGSLTVEFPIPENGTEAYLKYHDVAVVSVGKNVPCISHGSPPVTVSEWVTGSGENDRGVVTFPLVCNFEFVDDTAEDEFVLAVKVEWKTAPDFLAADTTGLAEIAVGASVGDKILIGTYTFDTKAPIDLGVISKITHVKVQNGQGVNPWPGDLKLQWSDNNLDFYDFTYTFLTGTVTGNDTEYPIDTTLYARYARLVNTAGGLCTDYSLVTQSAATDIEFYGSFSTKDILATKIMFVLDNDTTTCMQLPTQQTNGSPKYFWASLSNNVLPLGDAGFNIQLTGKGLTCNNYKGPQVTHPALTTSLKFRGSRTKCTFVTEVAGDPMSCTYACPCSGATQCAEVSLLIYTNAQPIEPYELCDVQIVA